MEIKNKILVFWGRCELITNLELQELAPKISEILCGGLPFSYGEHSIWEEIPSMYIEHSILGMLIIIGGYGGDRGFEIAIQPTTSSYIYEHNLYNEEIKIRMDTHLYHLLKEGLKDCPAIEVIEPSRN